MPAGARAVSCFLTLPKPPQGLSLLQGFTHIVQEASQALHLANQVLLSLSQLFLDAISVSTNAVGRLLDRVQGRSLLLDLVDEACRLIRIHLRGLLPAASLEAECSSQRHAGFQPSVRGRVLGVPCCLVTGASDGHGRAVARQLATRGADVVIHGRNADKCAEVQDEIAGITGGKRPEILLCDLASREQIAQAADEYLASGRRLDVLVNNAGLVTLSRQESVDGHELVFAVNFLATFQLTLRLLPRLVESAPARIVNVASDAYKIANLDLDDLALDNFSTSNAYARSKLALVYFTHELAKRIEGSGVTVNAVDPGPVASNIGANNPGFLYRMVSPLIRYLFPSANRAARTAMILATDSELENRSGGYYRSLKHRERPVDYDQALSQRLWDIASELTGAGLPASGLSEVPK